MNSTQCDLSHTTGVAPQLFTSAVSLLAATQCCFRDEFRTYHVKDRSYYDFIIVGAGSAGSVVANRLSEVSGWKILVLEAGPEPPIESFIPQLDSTLYNSNYDWNFTIMNNYKSVDDSAQGEINMNRGKMLGGTSMMNSMFYVKGRKGDYQSWFDAGNPSWSPENVNYYQKKVESLQNQELKSNPYIRKNYGDKGPQIINRFNNTNRELSIKILESWDAIGFKRVTDINSAEITSRGLSSIVTVTAADGMRYGTYNSYLLPAFKRNNLKIVTNAFVTKVLIDKNLRAYGVEVDINSKRIRLYVKFKVVISAGTISTPQLLMLSGIGPRHHLISKNIPCKLNLPAVGKNYQDHLNIFVPIYGDLSAFEHNSDLKRDVNQYCYNRTGYLADQKLVDITSLYSRKKGLNYAEFQNHLTIMNRFTKSYFRLPLKKSFMDSITEHIQDKTLYLFIVQLLHSYSTGYIYLNTSNPYNKPIINANFLTDYRDIKAIAKGIQMLTKIINTEYFKSINAFVHRIKVPECDKLIIDTIQYWMCISKNTAISADHPVGTSKMGLNPKNAVVNNFLRVHGIKNLRVIDASIMPTSLSGNPNAATLMIGEMGSSMIKKHYNLE